MKREQTYLVIGFIAAVGGAFWYYRRRVAQVQQQDYVNPNASTDVALGSIISNSTYQGVTGQTGDTVTANYRYGEYQQWLAQGGASSGTDFQTFYNSAQSQSVPLNS